MSRIQTPNFSGDIAIKHKKKFVHICIVIICVNQIDVSVYNDKICQLPVTDRWFSPGTPVSSAIKPDCHDITEKLLKVALNTITLN
jgi:hypothetical protein